MYESECKTIYEEREVDEDTIECETLQEEKCKEVEKGCVLNCEPICVKLPAKKCKVETKKVIKVFDLMNKSCRSMVISNYFDLSSDLKDG